MGESAGVRCSRHTEATLCASCAARLRALLAGRPGIRPSAPHHGVQPYALAAVMAVALLVGFARVLVAQPPAGGPPGPRGGGGGVAPPRGCAPPRGRPPRP